GVLTMRAMPTSPERADRATRLTSPRLRGEVDLRAELLRSDASRVRGRFPKLGLAETPPHPDSIAPLRFARHPTPHQVRGRPSPRKRGEVEQVARSVGASS